jgi:subtilisin family serine protease
MFRVAAFMAAVAATFLSQSVAARPVVAIIDSGIARTPELIPVLIAEYDVAADDMPRAAFRPRYSHGTQIATILHREAKGAVDIVSMRIDDPAGCPAGRNPPCQPATLPIVRAIRTAIALKVSAINISLALKEDPAIERAIGEAAQAGVAVIMAAGNDGFDHPGNKRMALAGNPRTVLVGALDSAGSPWRWTNKPEAGASLPYEYVWRLGVEVPSTNADGTPVKITGTSAAAPFETARRATRPAAAPVQTAAIRTELAAAGAP